MSLLESVIGGVVGQVFGGQRGGAMAPLVKALLMLLLEKGAAGGLGDLLGRGHGADPAPGGGEPGRAPTEADGGDIGGFGQRGGHRRPQPDAEPADPADASLPPGDFSDLSGMLDGPGGAATEPAVREAAGGLDDLAARFRRGGLGDVMESWIGSGANRPIAPDRLAHALGPDILDTLASRTGLDRATLMAQLAQVLPQVVDALTPHGPVPKR